jgi:hypothetical protein
MDALFIGRRAVVALAGCLLLGAGLMGCARTTVSHLESRPAATAAPASLAMKYFRFEFTGKPTDAGYVVRGRAMPVADDLPPWCDRLEELTLAAYLRDPSGTVLSTAEKRYPGMDLGNGAAVPFEFVLSPEGDAPGNYGISFGYKAVFGSKAARGAVAPGGPPPAGAVFFAGEGAVRMQ